MLAGLIVLGVIVALVVAGALWWRFRDPLRGDDYDNFAVRRQWDWEHRLSEAEETALMAGLRANGSVFVHDDYGVLLVRHPPMLISLYVLADRFRALGPSAMNDPVSGVRHLISQAGAGESGGVLHLRENWLPGEVDGMDKYGFRDAMSVAMMNPAIEGSEGSYAHEDYGYGILVVHAGPQRESVVAGYEEAFRHDTGKPVRNYVDVARAVLEEPDPEFVAALGRADGEKSRHTNTLLIDYARVLDRYPAVRAQMPGADPADVLGVVITRLLAERVPGATWIREPMPEEEQLAQKIIGTRMQR